MTWPRRGLSGAEPGSVSALCSSQGAHFLTATQQTQSCTLSRLGEGWRLRVHYLLAPDSPCPEPSAASLTMIQEALAQRDCHYSLSLLGRCYPSWGPLAFPASGVPENAFLTDDTWAACWKPEPLVPMPQLP